MKYYPRRKGVIKKKVTKKVKPAKLSKSMALAIDKRIHIKAENKQWERVATNQALNGAISGLSSVDPTCLNLVPYLTQGTGQSSRIGNQVRIVKNTFKGIINLLPVGGSATNQSPVHVKLWVFRPKSFTNYVGDMGNQNWKQFFQVNNADTGFYGGCLDLLQNVNTELYTVYTTRTYTLSAWTTTGGANQYASFTNPYSVKFTIDLTKYLKVCKYDDDSSNRPTNANLLIAFQTCYADGTLNGTASNNNIAELHYVNEIEYEDL